MVVTTAMDSEFLDDFTETSGFLSRLLTVDDGERFQNFAEETQTLCAGTLETLPALPDFFFSL